MGKIWQTDHNKGSDFPNVKNLPRLLCYLAKTKDDDGVDLHYFHEPSAGLRKCKKSSEIFESITRRPFRGTTTPTRTVRNVLNAYKGKLDQYRHRRSHSKRSSTKGLPWGSSEPERPKPLSVYVLTDGVWEDDQQLGQPYLDDTIRSLVEALKASGCEKDHVGVQFISFGNHQHGLQRLRALDKLSTTLALDR